MRHREHDEQVLFFRCLAILEGYGVEQAGLTFAVPNGARLVSVRHAKRMVMEGLRGGVPDIICPIAVGEHIGLAIEMKIPPNKSTVKQKRWQADLRRYRWRVEECHDGIEALKVWVEYHGLTPEQVRPLSEWIDG